MISVEQLTKRYGRDAAIEDVSFDVGDGETAVLLGPGDEGRTAILESLCGLLRFEGSISIGGHDIHSTAAKRLIGYIPKDPAPYPSITVAEHMEFVARAYRLDPGRWPLRADVLLRRFGLDGDRRRLAKQLGWDEQKRLGICCALLPEPSVVVFDEPFAWLGPRAAEEVGRLLLELRDGGCTLVVGARTARGIPDADTAYIVEQGRIAAVRRKEGLVQGGVQGGLPSPGPGEDGGGRPRLPYAGKARVSRTGIKGRGASAFFHRQVRELFREHRLGFFGPSTFLTLAIVVVFSLLIRGAPASQVMGLPVILPLLLIFQLMFVGNGPGVKELHAPSIYLVPEPSAKKLLWSNAATVMKAFLEGVVYLGVSAVVAGGDPLMAIAAAMAYAAASPLLLGAHYLSLRLAQRGLAQGLHLLAYFAGVLVLWAPGIIGGIALAAGLGGEAGGLAGLAWLVVWQLLAAAALFVPARQVYAAIDIVPEREAPALDAIG